MTALGRLHGGGAQDRTEPRALNNGGQVVGLSGPTPFVWNNTDGMKDLNTLLDSSAAGWTIAQANDINDYGEIVGAGIFNGQFRAVKLTPNVPQLYVVMLHGDHKGAPMSFGTSEARTALLRFKGVRPENLYTVDSAVGVINAAARIGATIHPGDSLIFYYVGHGGYRSNGTEPTVPISPYTNALTGDVLNDGDDFMSIAPGNSLDDDELAAIFNALPNREKINKLAIISACFSGGIWGKPGNGGDAGDLDKVPNTALLAAAEEDSVAYGFGGSNPIPWFSIAMTDALNALADRQSTFSFAELEHEILGYYRNGSFPSTAVIMGQPWVDGVEVPVPSVDVLSLFSAATVDFDRIASLVPQPDVVPEPGILPLAAIAALALRRRRGS